jgi:hypothetical protein
LEISKSANPRRRAHRPRFAGSRVHPSGAQRMSGPSTSRGARAPWCSVFRTVSSARK